ncbi:TetR/AcrR family transcriptional regulator [Methylobrevis albus]|uniref:TetR family transcriptional regulator n=1 Tax=Methylobrevis albus TaxID=2793297 RepID=A0A931I137_9HYPH|nr:TetR/AcrR family transcriptional regulator [Methylobrevis albus]MBH0237434.1 TetR family transcriptional regulator [Methylobrevis albus]
MIKPRGRPSSRDKIVAAAGELVRTEGAARLSLDAVAERAEISKGGLLYNFPTKSALLKALIGEYVGRIREERAAIAERLGDNAPNRAVRSHIAATMSICRQEGPPPAGLIAAIAEDPMLLEPIRAYNREIRARLAGDHDPDLSLIAFLAMEGICSLELFEISPLDETEYSRVVEVLERLLAGRCLADGAATSPAAADPAGAPKIAETT